MGAARTLGRAVGLVAVGLALFAGTAEVAVRALAPTPRVQVVDPARQPYRMVDGVPQWSVWPDEDPVLGGDDCAHTGARQVVIAGASSLRTYPAEADVTGTMRHRLRGHLTLRLQAALDASGTGPWCVRNVAQAGYQPYQSVAALRAADEASPAEVALLEVFKTEQRYVPVDGVLYAIDGWRRTARGVPAPFAAVPDAAQDALFRTSAAWAYATLALGGPTWERPGELRASDASYREAIAWAEARGLALILVEIPPLDRPFAQAAAEGAVGWGDLQRHAEAHGAGHLRLAEALAGAEVEALRLDTCCHFSAAGHEAVAEALAHAVLTAVPGSAPAR